MKTETIYKGNFLQIEKLTDGDIVRERVSTVTGKDAVAAIIFDDLEQKIILVKQHRHAIGQDTWEIPAGMMDIAGEAPKETMQRELKEEAGIHVTYIKHLVSYYPSVGFCDHKLHIYKGYTKNYNITSEYDKDVTEAKWFDLQDVRDMIKNGQIVDGKTILAFHMTI